MVGATVGGTSPPSSDLEPFVECCGAIYVSLPDTPSSLRIEYPTFYFSNEQFKMSAELSEDEMRQALFGSSLQSDPQSSPKELEPFVLAKPQLSPKPRSFAKPLSPKLRVTLHVTKDFEGDIEVFIYDANTLSTLVAEQEAKNEAKKKKFKYFDVVSVKPLL